jgi:hypothetical protein
MPTSIFDAPEETQTAQPTRGSITSSELLLNCRACRTLEAMSKQTIWRFPTILRIIGLLFIIPSVLGLVAAAFSLITSFATSATMMNGPKGQDLSAAAGLGFLFGFGFSIALGAWSLLAGTVGWIFWMNRKVWKCIRCGHFIDRA